MGDGGNPAPEPLIDGQPRSILAGAMLKRTPLFAAHQRLGGKLIENMGGLEPAR